MQGHSGDTVVGLQESQRVTRGAEKLTQTETESEESYQHSVDSGHMSSHAEMKAQFVGTKV